MTDLECSTRDGEAMPVPLRGRTITARPELVSNPDKVQRLYRDDQRAGPQRWPRSINATDPRKLARCNLVVRATLRSMHIEPVRENVVSVTLTLTELGALIAGARMALDALRSAPPGSVPEDAIATLQRVLDDYDLVRERMRS